MRTILIMVLGSLMSTSLCAQTPQKDLLPLLKPGKHLAAIISITPVLRPAEENKLLMKAAKGMQQNMKWFIDTFPNLLDSTALPEKYGLTKEEFSAFQRISHQEQNFKMAISGIDTLDVTAIGKMLTISARGKLAPLDALQINLQGNVINYKGKELAYKKATTWEDDAKNPFKARFTGHLYHFEDRPAKIDFSKISFIDISFSIGKLDNGKTALLLQHWETKDSKMVKTVILPVILD